MKNHDGGQLPALGPTIVRDRLHSRGRDLRTRWHHSGDALLEAHNYLAFADGLLRLMRQLDAIDLAVARLPLPTQFAFGLGQAANGSTRSQGTARPTRRPTGGIV